MIKRIIFDLGGVYFSAGTRIILKKLIKEFPDLLPEKIDYITGGKLGKDYRKGLYTKKEFWNKAQRIAGKFDTEKFARIWHTSYKINKGVESIVKKLSKTYHLGILSGTIRERIRFLNKKYDFKKYFKTRVFTYNLKSDKLNKKTYLKTLRMLNAKPKECLFIDDYPWHIKFANNQGIKTILFNNSEKLKKDLNKFGVKI
jgi:HAD superfamily hydrolase (TIGR01509 family)